MALRTIRTDDDDILRKPSKVVTKFDSKLHNLLDDMTETMLDEDGVGLAAPQVGVLRRVIVLEVEDYPRMELINPELLYEEGRQECAEGCLSVPGRQGIVSRPRKIKIKAQDRNGAEFETEADETLSVAICHEIDHLDGILYIDKVSRMLSKEEMEERQREEEEKERKKRRGFANFRKKG